jgi:hypothetical protein
MPETPPIPVRIDVYVHTSAGVRSEAGVTASEPVTAEVDRVAIIRDFLERIDPNALEAEALANIDVTGSTVASILNVLHDHAGDDS